jgi:BirA family transcriptional regulator, biotin operon repressor / biotin---[acetyl-CoA-carboxylase] ligase
MPAVLHRVDSVGSTQDLIHQFAARGDPAGTAVLAGVQTEGRGRRGRPWVSPEGGLWLSVLCRPQAATATEVLGLRAALAVARVVEASAPHLAIALKWPNDLMLSGRKLGGILCEARWQGEAPAWVAVGIGLNVGNPIPGDLADRAVALAAHAPGVMAAALAPAAVAAVLAASRIDQGLSPAETAALAQRDWLLGRRISEPVPGIADGITGEGLLRVRRETGPPMLVRSGTVVVRET